MKKEDDGRHPLKRCREGRLYGSRFEEAACCFDIYILSL